MLDTPVSFAQDIAPLFVDKDVTCIAHFGVRRGKPRKRIARSIHMASLPASR
jgi:hypothetical protein